jgi:aspartyl-tRNA(Asn)/glutamyl-tRNA(Gln) amidotransferase subunit A
VEAHIERAELDPELNTVATLTAKSAREDAERAARELATGLDRGPLHGIPVTLKDNIDVAGVRTTAGCRLYADRVPSADSAVAARLREAGAVLLGKANMHELALGVQTENPIFGRTRNPWDPTRIPGGSSGGSAAAVAAGIGLASIGTDSGGSIRVPAALCGLVGLRPTYGRVSNAGIVWNYPSFDCAGPIARTAADAAIVLRAIAGYDPSDFASVRMPVEDYEARLAAGVRGLRVAVVRELRDASAPDVRAVFDRAIDAYRAIGAAVSEVDLPLPDTTAVKDAARPELGQKYAEALRTRATDISDDVRAKLEAALATDLERHLRARRESERFAEAVRRAFEEVDLLAVPTVPVTAPAVGARAVRLGGADLDVEDALVAHTRVFSFARVPALTHPCGFATDGLPVGLQLLGRPFDDALLLRAAHAYAGVTDWHRRMPGVEAAGEDWRRVTH